MCAVDFNDWSAPQDGFGRFKVTQNNGERCSAYNAYLQGARRPNLRVATGAHVTRVSLEGGQRDLCASGVEYTDASGPTKAGLAAGGEVLLCAGAVQSPQILMLSGIGARPGPEIARDQPVTSHLPPPHLSTPTSHLSPPARDRRAPGGRSAGAPRVSGCRNASRSAWSRRGLAGPPGGACELWLEKGGLCHRRHPLVWDQSAQPDHSAPLATRARSLGHLTTRARHRPLSLAANRRPRP